MSAENTGASGPESELYARGVKKLFDVNGEIGKQAVAALKSVSPDFARILVEVSYGEIYSRPGLDLKQRELCAIAAIAVQGNAPIPLKAHIHGALRAGASRDEVVEVLIQILIFSGFLTSIAGLFAAKEVFDELDLAAAKES